MVILFVIAIAMGFWCVVSPESVRDFYRNHPGMDRYQHRTENASDIKLRITGVALIMIGAFGLVFLGIHLL